MLNDVLLVYTSLLDLDFGQHREHMSIISSPDCFIGVLPGW